MKNEDEAAKKDRAADIIERLRVVYLERFNEALNDKVLLAALDVKIEEAKSGFVDHMLKQLTALIIEPQDFYFAKEYVLNSKQPEADVGERKGRTSSAVTKS